MVYILLAKRFKQSCRWKCVCVFVLHINKLYHNCTNNRLPEDETLCSDYLENIVKIKILV